MGAFAAVVAAVFVEVPNENPAPRTLCDDAEVAGVVEELGVVPNEKPVAMAKTGATVEAGAEVLARLKENPAPGVLPGAELAGWAPKVKPGLALPFPRVGADVVVAVANEDVNRKGAIDTGVD